MKIIVTIIPKDYRLYKDFVLHVIPVRIILPWVHEIIPVFKEVLNDGLYKKLFR